MTKFDDAQLQAALENSQSGKGIRLDDVGQLKDFSAYALGRGAVVCNVETFEIRGDFEIMRVDLSIFDGGDEEQAMPSADRIVLSQEALQEVLAAIGQEGICCVFQVWSDDLVEAT